MTSYKAFLARVVLVVCAFIGAGGAIAQQPTPVEPPSQGRRVSGWMVDVTTYPRQGDLPALGQSFGIRGDQSAIMGPGRSVVNSRGSTLVYGRGFVKIDENGPYTFVVDANIKSRAASSSCLVTIRISKIIVSRKISKWRDESGPVFGSTDLSPGYYPLEFVFSCNSIESIDYSVLIRAPSDMAARPPRPDELFVVMR